MRSKILKSIKIFILSISILISSVGLYSFYDDDFEIAKNLDIFYSLFREVSLYYVDGTDPGELIKNGIDGMLKSLDPYTNFIPESKIEDYRFMTTGQYGGIGAMMKKIGDKAVITELYDDSPALKSGIKTGDKIVSVNGKSIADKSIDDLSEVLKGQAGTTVTLTFERPGTEGVMEKILTRENIEVEVVPHYQMLDDKTGYIRFTSFTNKAFTDVKAALVDLKVNHGMEKLILDIRGNGGGLLIEAVKIMNLFVDKGQEIVSTKGKVKSLDRSYPTTSSAYDTLMPVAVLVNSMSASASEIVSGSMQDLDRGIIVGTRTYGKGLVQATRDLSYNTKLKVTTAKYYIPSGRCIQALDYAHRNPDGSVGKVPDSLITEFSTANGRKVFDGGGIVPDVKIESETLSKVASELFMNDIIFDFVTEYCLKHDSVPPPNVFTLSESDYQDFIEFTKSKNFSYETLSEEFLDELEKVAKEEKYYGKAKSEFDALRNILANDLSKDLITFKDEISELISEEILQRYYFIKGSLEYNLKNDIVVKKALEVINDKAKYNGILKG